MDDIDRGVLEIEARWYRHVGRKVLAIHDELELTETGYYQRLNALLDDPEALAVDPVLVHRLRRVRDERVRLRTARRAS